MPYKRKRIHSVMESTHSCSRSGRKSTKYTAPDSNRAGPPNCVFFMDSDIRGIAGVGDNIFMVYYNYSHIGVHDSENLRAASLEITVPDMKSPWGLAGCAYNRALYISDWKPERIHRVDLTKKSFTRWNLTKNHESRGLSVTAEHTLLVTVEISDTIGESRVVEYTSEGQLLREIGLDTSIQYAWQTLQLSSDQFVVCHGGDSSLHRVCVINTEGEIITSYGRQKGDEDQLGEPYSMTIDDKSKRIFIADRVNHRVLMLETDLTCMYIDQIHTPPCFSLPSCIYFDSSSQRLLVGAVDAPMSRSTLSTTWTLSHREIDTALAVTAVGDEIFVLDRESPPIRVYDSHSLRASRYINIPDVDHQGVFAGCSHNKALYIGDYVLRGIHRVDVTNNSITRWRIKENYGLLGLSVTAGHTLLITTDTGRENKILEYTSEGKLVREISFDKSIRPCQAIQISSDRFIISNDILSDLEDVCIVMINTEGQIIKSYNWEGGEYEFPISIAIDYDNNHVFLSGNGSCNRVLMLDTDFTYIGQINLLAMAFLYFDLSADRIFMLESSGRILVVSHPDFTMNQLKL